MSPDPQLKSIDLLVRKAVSADAVLISVLAATTFYEAYFEQDDPHDLAEYIESSFNLTQIKAELADPRFAFFMAFRGKDAVGYAKLRDAEIHVSVESKNAIELQRIYILERVYGTGVGEHLLEHCIAEARKLAKDTFWLGVWEENKRAQKFYAKRGFRQTGTLQFPYGDSYGINLVMQIDIGNDL